MLFQSLEFHYRNMLGLIVAKLPVHLVAQQVKVVLNNQFFQLLQLLTGVQIAGRVVGVANEDGLGAGGNQLFNFGKGRQGKIAVEIGGQRNNPYAGGRGKAVVVGVERLGHNHLVAHIQAAQKGQTDGFGAAGGHHQLRDVDVDADVVVVFYQLFTVRFDACRVAVSHHIQVEPKSEELGLGI